MLRDLRVIGPDANRPIRRRRNANRGNATRGPQLGNAATPNSRVNAHFSVPISAVADAGSLGSGSLSYAFAPIHSDWWSQLARLYNKFRLTSLRVTFEPALSSFATGQYALILDSDPVLTVPTFEQISNGYRALTKPIRNAGTVLAHPSQLQRLPWYYTGGSTVQPGNNQICAYLAYSGVTTGTDTEGDVAIGRLVFDFGLELSEPSATLVVDTTSLLFEATPGSFARYTLNGAGGYTSDTSSATLQVLVIGEDPANYTSISTVIATGVATLVYVGSGPLILDADGVAQPAGTLAVGAYHFFPAAPFAA